MYDYRRKNRNRSFRKNLHRPLSFYIDALRRWKFDLRSRSHGNYVVESISIFGSVAREQHGPSSDIDILIRFSVLPSLFDLVRIERLLSKRLGMRVDLLVENGSDPEFVSSISEDIVRVF